MVSNTDTSPAFPNDNFDIFVKDVDGDVFPKNMDYSLATWHFDDMRWMIIVGTSITLAFAPVVLMVPSRPPPASNKTISEETTQSQSI